MNYKIIAIVGAAKAGKSTVAETLNNLGFEKMSFAAPLKEMLSAMGLDYEKDLAGADKEKPNALLCGKTPRHAMQTLGTEWRDMIDKRLWSNIMQHRINIILTHPPKPGLPHLIYIDDCRFEHEVEMLKAFNATFWRVRRPEVEPPIATIVMSRHWLTRGLIRLFGNKPLHPSETHWPEIDADEEFWNDGTKAELEADVRMAANGLLKRRL